MPARSGSRCWRGWRRWGRRSWPGSSATVEASLARSLTPPAAPWLSEAAIAIAERILHSHQRAFGAPLIAPLPADATPEQWAQALHSVQGLQANADYSGIRIDSQGRRFRISGARVWTLPGGQAAAFSTWHWL